MPSLKKAFVMEIYWYMTTCCIQGAIAIAKASYRNISCLGNFQMF